MQACGFISNILAARLIAIMGLITLSLVAAVVALDQVIIFPAGYHSMYIVYNVVALLLSLLWLLTLAFGAFRFNVHILTVSIILQAIIVMTCIILATVILLVGLGDYRDHETVFDHNHDHELNLSNDEVMLDASSRRRGHRQYYFNDVDYMRESLIAGLYIYAVIQAFCLFVTICTRNEVRRMMHGAGGAGGGGVAGGGDRGAYTAAEIARYD